MRATVLLSLLSIGSAPVSPPSPPPPRTCDHHCASCDGTSCTNCVTANHGCTYGNQFYRNPDYDTVHATKVADGAITLDGDLSDWDGHAHQYRDVAFATVSGDEVIFEHYGTTWTGPEDFSVGFMLSWDSSNLYLAIEVVDDIVGASGTCYANGVQTAFEVAGAQGSASPGMLQAERSPSTAISRLQLINLGLRPESLDGNGGAFCDSQSTTTSETCCVDYELSQHGGFQKQSHIVVSRDGDTGVTTYELAFAIVDLLGTSTEHAGQWKEGLRFGFSFLVNEGTGAQLGWAGYYPHSMVHGWNGGQKEPGKTGVVQLAAPQDGAADCLSLNFELDAETECPAGWECEGQAQVHRNGHPITGPCTQSECSFGNVLTYHGLGQQGDQYLYLGGDNDLGSATSRPFYVPTGATKLKFLRAGGADAPSGLYLKVFASDSGSYEPGATLCSPADNTPTGPYGGFYSNTGHNTDVMFEATCEFGPNVDALTSVYLYVHDSTYGGWAKTFVDDFRFFSDLDEQIDATFDGNGDRLSCLYTANPPDMPSPPPPPSPPPVPAIPPAPTMHWCEGAVGGDFVDLPLTNDGAGDGVRIITHPDMDFVDDSPLTSGPCSWYVADSSNVMPGLHQGPTSYAVAGIPPVPNANAWGNAPGDNTLMGCNAIYKHREFTEFILEADVSSFDNDGVGFNFGVRGNMCGAPGSPSCAGVANSRYTAIMINDRWPSPAADGVGGPHFKIKMQNGRDCTANMDATNNCFDTLAYLNNEGHFQATEATAASGNAATDRVEAPLPPSYAQTYQAYPRNVHLTLIVKDREARAFWHDSTMSIVNAVKAKLPASYVGGKVGLFTYAHSGWFSNLKITDIGATAESMPTDYCNVCTPGTGCTRVGTCTPGTGLCAQLPPMPPSPPPLPPTSPPSPKLPSPPPPSTSSSDELDAGSSAIKAGSDGLDTGAIAGIAVGGGVLVAAVVIVGFFCFRESRRKGASASLAKATPVEMQVSATGDAPAQVEMEGKA